MDVRLSPLRVRPRIAQQFCSGPNTFPAIGSSQSKTNIMKALTKIVFPFAALLALASSGVQAAGPEDAMVKAGCTACHNKDKKIVGPSYKQIAEKYKGKGDVTLLLQKVRKGGSGVFGPVPMAPNPPEKISDADLKAAVEFILKH
jgi:cytochrome c